jgi:hypothetical protein
MIYIHKKTRGGWRCGSSSRVCLVRTKPFVQTSVPLKKEKEKKNDESYRVNTGFVILLQLSANLIFLKNEKNS